jgi:hypothetical protein
MLKSFDMAASHSDLPEGAYLLEATIIPSQPFSGVVVRVLDGMAHLIFYTAQPSGSEDREKLEYIAVARMVAPDVKAAAILSEAAARIAQPAPATPERERPN